MPWQPLPRIAFAVATFPFQPSSPADLPLELGDELYIIEQGGTDGSWYRGYLVAPPSLLAGLTCRKGQTLEARVFSGIFPKSCVEVREELGEVDISQKLMNGNADDVDTSGDDSNHSQDVEEEQENGQSRAAAKRPKLTTHDSLKGLGLVTNQRHSQSRDITPTSENGLSYKSSPLMHPKSRKSTGPIPHAGLDARDPQASKPPAPVPMLKIGDETPTSLSEPLVDEIASCLREWHSTNLHELLLNRQYGTLEKMSAIVSQLDLNRRQLLHDVLTGQERLALREQAVWDLVKGNKMLSGEVIVRDPVQRGRLLTGEDSAIEMTKLQSVMSLLDSGRVAQPESAGLHHLLLEIKGVSGAERAAMILTASLCLKAEDGEFSPLSETFTLDVYAAEDFAKSARTIKLKTLFTDLSASDVGEAGAATTGELYLILKLLASQKPKPAPPSTDSIPLSRNGTLTNKTASAPRGAQQDTLKGGRRSIRFGSIRKTGPDRRNASNQNGRLTPQEEEAPPTPISKEAPVLEASSKTKVADVFRTIGVGLLNIQAVVRQGKDVDQSVVIWCPALAEEEKDDDNDNQMYDPAISKLLRSATGRYTKSTQASQVNVQLSPFTSPDAQSLIRRNPTRMHMITQTQKIGFSEAPTKMRADIYITLSEAVISRAALLSHPESGSIQIARSSPFQNLQITMEVRDGLGRRIENSIYPSSNSPGHTAWRTVVVEQGDRWGQTICLKIPPGQVSGSHLIMSIAEAPEFPFGLVWMPLWDQQAFIHDGRHSLLMHAYDRTTSSVTEGKGAYLSLPWQATGKDFASQIGDASGHMATLIVESYLCSTEHSQDQVIIGLINWKQQSSSTLLELLKKIVFVPEIEIVKQRSDVFDALFALLVHKSGDSEYEDLIFNDLVTVLGIVHDRRFNLGPLVDQYAEHHFEFPSTAPCLIRSYTRLLRNASDPQQSRNLRALFKVGRYIMKFIITARQQQKFQAEGLVTRQNNFNEDMQLIFRCLENLMRNESAALVGSKTLLVQHFHSWLPELLSVFSADEVIRIATKFIDSCEAVKGKLVLYRIILMLNYSQIDDLWRPPAERQKLIADCVRWLAPYWGETDRITEQWREQVRLCASVVAELLKEPTSALYDFMPKIVTSYCTIKASGLAEKSSLSLLFSKTYQFSSRPTKTKETFDEALLELAALMSSISSISSASARTVPNQELSRYVLSTLTAQLSIIECGAYPGRWLSLHIYHHRSSLEILKYISTLLRKSFLPSPDFAEDFDMELWKTFFMTLLKIVGSDVLALETFPEQKRRAVWKIAGDVRENGAELLRQAWDAIGWETSADENRRYGLKRLGGYQVQYVPSLVSPIVELCLSVHEGVRRVAVEILKTMIVSEWALSEDLSPIETEMIASLDVIFKTKRINESVTQKLFIGELLEMFGPIASQPDDALWVALKELLATIDELLDLLIAAHGDSMESSLHTLRLMDFMKDMQKEDIYIRYVHDLAQAQERSKNNTEAGLALQLHADLYSWNSNKILPALTSPIFPAQSAFDRKEAIYFQMIQHFENGRAWLLALMAYKKLADLYEHVTFDFFKLARTQRAMGHINESIAKEPRQSPRYFKVSYRGLGFPPSIRDKQYIFEESPSERMSTFTDRMQKQHPAAQVTQAKEVDDMEGQFVHVASVSAQRDFNHPVNSRTRLPASIKDHILASNPVQFSATLKRHTAGTDVKEHWIEKVVYTTAETFPNILRQSEIVSTEEVRLSPIQTAIERTWRKTTELNILEKRAASGEDPNNGNLTAALLQLLDINSSSGSCLANYRQLLPEPSKEFQGDHVTTDGSGEETDTDATESDQGLTPTSLLEAALYVALSDHAAAIKHCLTLYARPSLKATRKDLCERFDTAYPQEARQVIPPGPEHEPSSHSHSQSGSSDVHRPFVDPPNLHEGKTSMEYAKHESSTNGRVVSPDLSEAGRMSRQSRAPRLSLQAIRGAATSMLPGMNEPRRMNTVHSRTNTAHSIVSNLVSAPTDPQANGILTTEPFTGTTFPDASSRQSTKPTEETEQSNRATSISPHEVPTVKKRRSLFGSSTTSDVPGPAIVAPSSETNDQWGRSLKDSLGANISTSRFETHEENKTLMPPGEEDARPVTAESGNSGNEVKKVAKKRFSLMRLGLKKSGNSLSTRSDLDGVEEK
jgi:dedicator of cytokinesis protein 3